MRPVSIAVLAVLLVIVGTGLVLANSNDRTDDPLGVAISPQTLLLGSVQSGTVVVHTAIPYSTVDASSLKLEGICASGVGADSLGHVVASFPEDAVKDLVSPPGAVLTLTGSYRDGGSFAGSDSVRVVE